MRDCVSKEHRLSLAGRKPRISPVIWQHTFIYRTAKYTCFAKNRQYGIVLTHWGRVTHICVGNLIIIGSVNGLSPGRRQAIIWTDAGILLIGPLGANFSEILIGHETFLFKEMRLKISSAKWRTFCLGLNMLIIWHGDLAKPRVFTQLSLTKFYSYAANYKRWWPTYSSQADCE